MVLFDFILFYMIMCIRFSIFVFVVCVFSFCISGIQNYLECITIVLSLSDLDPKIKNRSRIHYLMANIEASKFKGKDNWALLLDDDGFISEGTGDNFFIVKNGEIITPEGRNILRGISRDYIFEICNELNIKCIEKNIDKYDVLTADEAFMTGTPFCMLPVTKLNNQKIGDGKVGKVFSILLEKWSKNVGINIKKQIQKYSEENSNNKGLTPYSFKK